MPADDLQGIRNVLALYCHVVDNEEWDRIGEVYATDGSYGSRGGERHAGLEAIVEYLKAVPHPPAQHMSSNHYIELGADGDSATGRGKWLVVFADANVFAGDYEDVYTKTESGWRIQSRTSFVRVPTRQES